MTNKKNNEICANCGKVKRTYLAIIDGKQKRICIDCSNEIYTQEIERRTKNSGSQNYEKELKKGCGHKKRIRYVSRDRLVKIKEGPTKEDIVGVNHPAELGEI